MSHGTRVFIVSKVSSTGDTIWTVVVAIVSGWIINLLRYAPDAGKASLGRSSRRFVIASHKSTPEINMNLTDKDTIGWAIENGFTFWATPCSEFRAPHYTYDLAYTVRHAKACHPDSCYAYDPAYDQSHKSI